MAVFSRVLEATRANLNVMRKLRELRTDRLEYSERQAVGAIERGRRRWGPLIPLSADGRRA